MQILQQVLFAGCSTGIFQFLFKIDGNKVSKMSSLKAPNWKIMVIVRVVDSTRLVELCINRTLLENYC